MSRGRKTSTGERIRSARVAKGWSQKRLAEKAAVGGASDAGRTKVIQRIESGHLHSVDVLKKVVAALGLDAEDFVDSDADGARVRRERLVHVKDGQECVRALLSLSWEGLRFCWITVERDLADDELDDAVLAVCDVVDRVCETAVAEEDWARKHAPGARRPTFAARSRHEIARVIGRAARALEAKGWRLLLEDEWVEHPPHTGEQYLTRRFRVRPA